METLTRLNPLTRLDPALRWMVHLDLPKVMRIAMQRTGLRWDDDEFLTILQSINTVGHVAEIGNDIVGFMIYRIHRDADAGDMNEFEICRGRFANLARTPPAGGLQIDLLNIAVAPELHQQGIGRALLRRLEQKIEREGGCIHALVPETNLAMQLFLRAAGYRATGVLRGYHLDEDAYLMEKWSGSRNNAASI
jgi:ribosomal-protein-alanine N-acetyltransferase